MANPADLADIIKIRAAIESGGGISLQSFSEPVFVSAFAASVDFPDRVEPYVGQLSDMQAKLIADGFSANDPAYRQITSAKLQLDAPETIYIGRVDALDVNYAESLTAIFDDASSKEFSLYFLTVDERDAADIEQIADWVNQRSFVLYVGQTDSIAVKNNQPGNVAANIIAKGYDTTALMWHDPIVASNYGPAVLSSSVGPFVLPSITGDFKLRINEGAEQTFTLIANAAVVLGVNTEPFTAANGDVFGYTIDGGDLQQASVVMLPAVSSSGVETFNIPVNSSLQVAFDGEPPLVASFPGLAGSAATTDELYTFIPADSVTFDIDGAGPQVIPLPVAITTRAQLKAALDALTGATVTDTGTSVVVTSNTVGSSSDVEITAITANALAELGPGFAVGNNPGSGFAANFAAVTATELQVPLQAAYAAKANVTVNGTFLDITTLSIGKAAAVRVVAGAANDAIGFSTSEFRGQGSFNDGAAVTAGEFVEWLSENFAGASFNAVGGAIEITTRSRGALSSINIAASAVATTLGLPVGITTSIGSNVNNAAEVNASEVSSVIFATPLVDGTTASANARFTISSLVNGPSSTIELTGGTYADVLFDETSVAGTGTDEDYLDCAWVGRCSTFRLDTAVAAGGGQSTWDNAPLVGVFPDTIDPTTRQTLHNTLKTNTYERRQGRNETHFGTVLFGNADTFRYIDQRVSIDWGWARSVETFKSTLNALADVKARAPNTDDGIQLLANDWIRFLRTGEANGHWVFDDTEIRSNTDTGITIPTRAQQTNANVNLRLVSGFRARFQFQDAIHRAEGDLNLTSFVEFEVAS